MTAAALPLSTGRVSTAKMLVPLSCAAACFSASALANTSTTMCEASELMVSTDARRFSTSRASIARSWVVRRLPPICSSAVATESTGRTEVWPLSASPISRRKSSRVEMAMISAAARADGVLLASLPPSRDRFDAGLGTGLHSLIFYLAQRVRVIHSVRKRTYLWIHRGEDREATHHLLAAVHNNDACLSSPPDE